MANTYCALYRKYRPENLDDVVGQNVIVQTLKNAIKNNYVSHAYLFTGPRGTGKTSIAKILAKTINCSDLQNTSPCNKCVSCTQINQKQNVDIIEIDAASNNGVDEIREIRNKVSLVPSISKYKVYIIDEVHMLTTGAFNALLKTLEEPPSHIVFILATTEPHKVPNTILSRCQRFDFKRISIDDIFSRLKFICSNENITITEDALKEIAISSDGGMRDAIGTLDQVISYAENNITVEDVHEINGTLSHDELSNFIDLLLDSKLDSLLEKIDSYYNSGKNIVKMSEEMVLFLKNILLYKTAPNYFEHNYYDHESFKKYDGVDVNKVIDYITKFNAEINEIKKSNIPKFLLELLLIKIISSNNQNSFTPVNTNFEEKKTVVTKKEVITSENKEQEKTKDKIVASPEKVVTKQKDYSEIQSIRIGNTLSRFSKPDTIRLRKEFENLNALLMNPDVSQIVSIILDAELKAASEEYIVFVLETQNSTDLFNDNIQNIEQVLNDFFERKYKVIGVEHTEWEKIKTAFNSKTKTFEYKEEPEITISSKEESIPKNEIEEIFGETIEYEK